jgi:hypothetical protein
MRLVSAFVLLCVLGVTPAAFADVLGCGCGDDTTIEPNRDMTAPNDQAVPRDLSSSPPDLWPRDARRDRRRRRRSAGAGMMVLSGLGVCGVVVARRRVRA